jgi:hypothetical protein
MAILLAAHVVISFVGLGSGFVVLAGLLQGKRLDGWTALFLGSTLLTSLSGFPLPADHLLPSHIVGVISVVVLVLAIVARYPRGLAGPWRRIYVVTALIALYLNVFVAVVQAFLKVPALTALAPTQSEPPFAIAQLVVLALFVALTVVAARRFRGTPLR